jgi:hypothetical protein
MYYSWRTSPLKGFRTIGPIAQSKTETMGDPCQLWADERWDEWCELILARERQPGFVGRWQTLYFRDVKLRVLVTGADGGWYGCAIDTATIVRLKTSDLTRINGILPPHWQRRTAGDWLTRNGRN